MSFLPIFPSCLMNNYSNSIKESLLSIWKQERRVRASIQKKFLGWNFRDGLFWPINLELIFWTQSCKKIIIYRGRGWWLQLKNKKFQYFFLVQKFPMYTMYSTTSYMIYMKKDRMTEHACILDFSVHFKGKNTFLNTKTTKYWYLQKKKEDYLKRL